MRIRPLLALLVFAGSAAAQPVDEPITLDELLERVREGRPNFPECLATNDASGRDMSSDECASDEYACMRIHNASEISFDSFEVQFYSQREKFGPIGAGETSAYRQVGCAYWYNYAEARSGERLYSRMIIDHIGNAFLPPGYYTVHYRVREFDEPRSGGCWIIHGFLGDDVELSENAP